MKTNTSNDINQADEKMHPFERAGMGVGPYKWVGTVEIPNAAEFANSAAGFGGGDPYAEIKAAKLKAGAGTCCCCGMGIMTVCVVQDASGDRWGVGSDCVMKSGEQHLGDAAKIAIARRRAQKRDAKREQERKERQAVFDAMPAMDKRALPGETNGQMQARLNAEWRAQETARLAHARRMAVICDALNERGGQFCRSMAYEFSQGRVPAGRALEICRDIYAKSKNYYDEAAAEFDLLIANGYFKS